MEERTTYRNAQPETTDWDDAQRKIGNLPPLPERAAPPPMAAARGEEEELRDTAWMDRRSAAELERIQDDDVVTDDRFMEEYRRRRLEELKQMGERPHYGSVHGIEAADFVPQVSHAGDDVWVLVHLYKDAHSQCELLDKCLEEFAHKYPEVKCVRIVSTDCIPGYPDSNLPTLLVYRNTDVVRNFVGLQHFDGPRITPEAMERVLQEMGVCCDTDAAGRDAKQAALDRLRHEFAERLAKHDSDEDSDFGDD